MSRPPAPVLTGPTPVTHPLADGDAGSGFSCEHEALNRFLRESAGQNQDRDMSRTWILRRSVGDDPAWPLVLGFYTLGLASVKRETLPPEVVKRLPKYPIPAILIARLARDHRVKGKGIGEKLLDDAHRRALSINALAGAVLVIVDAKDVHARDFYAKFGYQQLLPGEVGTPEWPLRMYLRMKDLRAAFAEASEGSV
jgi:GNAT superfamily N-acetyltransferase